MKVFPFSFSRLQNDPMFILWRHNYSNVDRTGVTSLFMSDVKETRMLELTWGGVWANILIWVWRKPQNRIFFAIFQKYNSFFWARLYITGQWRYYYVIGDIIPWFEVKPKQITSNFFKPVIWSFCSLANLQENDNLFYT